MGSRRLRSRPRYLAPVEVKDIDVYDISPETVGTFDIVPNLPCVEAMLHEVGFEHIRFTPTPIPRKWTLLDRIK